MKEFEEYSAGSWYFDMKDQLRQFVYKRSDDAFTRGDGDRDRISTVQELEIRKDRMRLEFIKTLGGLPDSSLPLNPKIAGIVRCDGFRIEKIIFESRPSV